MLQREFHDRLNERAHAGGPFVVVTLIDVHGSTPADAGAKMVVDSSGRDFGTVGGGRIEAQAIAEAQSLIESGEQTRFADWSLKADVGMTCGGRVRMFFEAWNTSPWKIVVFGAGHVTQALANLLIALPCQLTCIDPRADWLAKLPSKVNAICMGDPKAHVAKLDDQTFVMCMTRGHKSDLPILKQIFTNDRNFAFLGVIGSRAKAAVLRKELIDAGCDENKIEFHCPIGLPIGSNHPAEIAVSIAAQLLSVRDAIVEKS